MVPGRLVRGARPQLALCRGRARHRGPQRAEGDVLVFCEVKTRSLGTLRLTLRGRHPGQAAPGASRGEVVAAPCAPHRHALRDRSLRRGSRDDAGWAASSRSRCSTTPSDPMPRACGVRCAAWGRAGGGGYGVAVSTETIIVERDGGVVTVTLNRPERKNAGNGLMWQELSATFAEVARRRDDRVVVLTGAGGAFCSGADIADPSGVSGDPTDPHIVRMQFFGQVMLALHKLPKPTIAKVRGIAAGAGMSLALGCDLTVASDNARFSEIFARRGLSVDGGSSWLLPRLVGLHKAKELAYFADILSARGSGLVWTAQPRRRRRRARRLRRRLGPATGRGPAPGAGHDQDAARQLDVGDHGPGARGRGPVSDHQLLRARTPARRCGPSPRSGSRGSRVVEGTTGPVGRASRCWRARAGSPAST